MAELKQMNKTIIVIVGYLASGKSTFARLLSKTLSIPYIVKAIKVDTSDFAKVDFAQYIETARQFIAIEGQQ